MDLTGKGKQERSPAWTGGRWGWKLEGQVGDGGGKY